MASSSRHLAATALLLLAAVVVLSPLAPQAAHAQTAPSPSPAAPKTITSILTKAGQFTKFLQLLQSTREAEQITNQLKGGKSSSSSGGGLTVFAPPDNAFSALPRGALNSLTDQQKTSLVQFHVVSAALPAAQLETASNPLRTQAGDTGPGKYPLNLTAGGSADDGSSSSSGGVMNLTTGVVNATLDGTPLYEGDRLVVYQVSKVLLPWALYGPPLPPAPAPAPAPAASKKKKKGKTDALADAPAAADEATTTTSDAAAAMRKRGGGGGGVAAAAASSYCVAVAAVAAACLWWAV